MAVTECTLQMVKSHLPPPGTALGCYTFLSPEALWTGTMEEVGPFVAVAEDDWPGGGPFLLVAESGPVYIGDRAESPGRDCLLDRCAASFPQFMELFRLFQTAAADMPSFSLQESEAYEAWCAETEQVLRRQMMAVDPTALEDEESLWSTTLEEFGAGML